MNKLSLLLPLVPLCLFLTNYAIAGTCNPSSATNSNGNGNVTPPGQQGNICQNNDGSLGVSGSSNSDPTTLPYVPQTSPSTNGSVAGFGMDPNPYVDNGNGTPTSGPANNNSYGAHFNTNAFLANTPTTIGNNVGQTSIYSNSNGVQYYGPSGATIRLRGIAPGTGNTDAVNVYQLNTAINGLDAVSQSQLNSAINGLDAVSQSQLNSAIDRVNAAIYDAISPYASALKQGLASVAAMSNVPRLDRDKMFSIGIGLGGVGGEQAYAAGASLRVTDNIIINGTMGRAFGSNRILDSTTWGAGAAIGW